VTTIQIIDPTSSPTLREWPSALYLHIPFCPTHCHYCDFAVTVGTTSLIEQYVQYLLQEIELTPSQGQPLASVYFGGGTPSLLTPQQLERILLALDHHFHIAKTAEITLEANPGTLNKRTLTTFQHLGINRISLGVQTFDETMLKRLGRNHTVQDTYEAVDAIRRAGFTNLSLDLMFGLPEQTLANWQTSLTSALALAPEHISAYDLILEPTTPFGRAFQSGCAPLPTEEATITMYLDLIEQFQQAGYVHYEIASLARPGYTSRHNLVYWHNQGYYGLGVGATGYVLGQRVTRPKRLVDYFTWVEHGVFTEEIPITPMEELGESLMLGLRLVAGVDLTQLRQQFGPSVDQKLAGLTQVKARGLVQETAGQLRLVYPQGFLLANEVLQECI